MHFLGNLITSIEALLLSWAGKIPLELFAFLGSIIEEIIAPIPSPLVMATAGSISFIQHKAFVYLLLIAFISTIGKTLGCLFFYVLADKAEDIIMPIFGKFFGITHKEIEGLGKHFNGTNKDDIILIILRAIPIMPSTPISLACGFIKLNMFTFIRSTMIGAFFRSLMFLYLGYSGAGAIAYGLENISSLIQILIALLLVIFLGFIYYKRGKSDLLKSLKQKIKI
jgi:membrane protein DedA with SNARE-associated domain